MYRPEVFSIAAGASLAEAALRMQEHHVASLVILDGEEGLAGIITERDLARAAAQGREPISATVDELMVRDPVTISPSAGLREAAAEMLSLDVRHLPVVLGRDVLGMLSMRDLMQALVEHEEL